MKNRYIAALLDFFLGGLGVHKFYLRKWTGVFYLILCWTYIPTIVSFIEGILYLTNGEREFNRKYNKERIAYQQQSSDYLEQNYNSDNIETSLSKICQNCGKENEIDSNFCERCGNKL